MSIATLDQAKHILVLLGQKNPSKEDLTVLFKSGLLSDLVDADLSKVDRDDFRKLLGLHQLDLQITVDCGVPFEDMVSACSLDWARGDITSRLFPVKGVGKKIFRTEIVTLDCDMSPDGAIARISSKKGLRQASIEELLAFCVASPETQRRFKIVAIGSLVETRGNYEMPYLGTGSAGRTLDLLSCSMIPRECRLLAVYE